MFQCLGVIGPKSGPKFHRGERLADRAQTFDWTRADVGQIGALAVLMALAVEHNRGGAVSEVNSAYLTAI